MKLIDVIGKIFDKEGNEIATITTGEVVLEALCAHRDKLIMSEDYGSLETQTKIGILNKQIVEIWRKIPVR